MNAVGVSVVSAPNSPPVLAAPIVAEWEAFAHSLTPAATGMNPTALRDHAEEILTAIIHDMRSQQTAAEQAEKSKGRGTAQRLGSIGKIHAALRIENGFKLVQLVAEYRALRASVLRLWQCEGTDGPGVTRFNESIDEALTEAVDCFNKTTEQFRDRPSGSSVTTFETPSPRSSWDRRCSAAPRRSMTRRPGSPRAC